MATTFYQQAFRFREDNGSETTATWQEALNTNRTQDVTTEHYFLRVRLGVRQTGTTSATLTGRLYIAKNGGSYAQASATSTTGIKAVASANFTDNAATTQQITSGGSGFVAGKMDDVNGQTTATATMAQNRDTEHEFMLELDYDNLADGDYFDFRLRNSTTALTGYTVTPRLTINKVSGLLKISKIADNFNDNKDNAVDFGMYKAGTSTITETGNRQEHAPQASLASSGTACYPQLYYDLASSCSVIKVDQVLNASADAETSFRIAYDADNFLIIRVLGASQVIQAFKVVWGTWTQVGSDITYNATNMKWWRIRESGGTIYFEYSATALDGSWSSIGSTAKPIIIAMVWPEWGTYADNVATPGTAIFDNFNVAPAPILNSPADTTSINDLTPLLDFTGDDPCMADLEYQIQLNTSSTFNDRVAYDNSSTTGVRNTLGLPITLSHVTANNSNRMLILATTVRGAVTVSNYPTYNGVNLTYLGSKQLGSDERVELWYLANPAVGNNTLSVNFSGDQNISVTVATYYNVASIALGGNGSGSAVTASSVANTNATSDVIVDIIGLQSGGADPSSTTLTRRQYGNNANEGFGFGDTLLPTANLTEVWTFTSNYYAELCAILTPSTLPILDKISTTDAGFANPDGGGSLLFPEETFEGGSVPASFDSKETDVNGSVAIDATSKVTGTYSAKVTRTGAGGTSLVKTLGSAVSELYIKQKVFIPTAFTFTGTYAGFMGLLTTGGSSILDANLEDFGTLRLTLNNPSMGWVDTGIDISKNAVHTIQIYFKISATVGQWKVWVDTDVEGTPTAQGSGTLNTGTTNFQKIRTLDPYSDGAHGDMYFDDFSMDDTFITAGDTHPFTQAQNIQYTPQSNLSVTTYYWRVRSLDINDANVWSDWSTIKSFVVTNDTVTPKTLLGKASILVTTLKTLLGRARVTISTAKTLLGRAKINLQTSKTIQGIGRVTVATLKTLLGNSRILATTSKTLLGLARITIVTSKTLLGRARITIATAITLLGKSRVAVSTAKALLGLARVTATTTQTLLGRARVEIATVTTLLGKSRIGIFTEKTIQGISAIILETSKTITGLANITTETSIAKTILGKANILIVSTKTLLGKARISVSTALILLGKSRIMTSTSKTLTGISRVLATTSKTLFGKARITATALKTLLGRARITVATQLSLLGKSRIGKTTQKTIQGLGRIMIVPVKTLLGKARVAKDIALTLLGKSAIILLTAKTILGKSRIGQYTSKTLTGISRILATTVKSLLGRARVRATTALSLLGKSRVAKDTQKIITGISRIVVATVKNVTGKASVLTTVLISITGVANILVIVQKAILGHSRIEVGSSKDINGKARIVVTYHKPILLTTKDIIIQLEIKKGVTQIGSIRRITTLKSRRSTTTI